MKARKTMNTELTSQELETLLLKCIKLSTELSSFDKWLDKQNIRECKVEAIKESIELLTTLYPHLSQLQEHQAFQETCELLGFPEASVN